MSKSVHVQKFSVKRTCILMLFIPIKHYSLLLMIFTFTLTLFTVHNKPKCEFFPELCQKKYITKVF